MSSIPYSSEYRSRIGGLRGGELADVREKHRSFVEAEFIRDFGFVPSSESEYYEAKPFFDLGFRGDQLRAMFLESRKQSLYNNKGAFAFFYDSRFRVSLFFVFVFCSLYLLIKK